MSTEKGVKLDSGKNRLGLVFGGFSHALWLVGQVGTFGANKYTDNGWQSVENGKNRYTDALLRHLFKVFMGEKIDEESGLPHLAHACWNALAILELTVHEKQKNNQNNDILKKLKDKRKGQDMEKIGVQGKGEIIAKLSTGKTVQVETWLYGEGEHHYEDDRIDSYTVRHTEWWEVDEDSVVVAYPDECEPEQEGTIEEILEFVDFESIEWSER